MELNHWQPETANPRGAISFSGGVTAITGQTTRSPNSYASALLGLASSYSKSIQFYEMKTREWQLAWYVRDRWQVSRKLTVNMGLRYEYYPLINRGDRASSVGIPPPTLSTRRPRRHPAGCRYHGEQTPLRPTRRSAYRMGTNG